MSKVLDTECHRNVSTARHKYHSLVEQEMSLPCQMRSNNCQEIRIGILDFDDNETEICPDRIPDAGLCLACKKNEQLGAEEF